MSVVVTGSIATDYLMRFGGSISDQLLAEHLDHVSLSFLVDDLQVRRGGVAANITFGMARLGAAPVLVGAVGADFADDAHELKRHGVNIKYLHVSSTRGTARFLCTSDRVGNQIASFYAGAMTEAPTIDLAEVFLRSGAPDLVHIGADDPWGMRRHTQACRAHGVHFAADPAQQLATLDGSEIRDLVDGATYLFTNQYEASLLLAKTEWSKADVLTRVGTWVTTCGDAGVIAERRSHPPLHVGACPVTSVGDPTGAGDAFRAGFLWALTTGLPLPQQIQTGCALAAVALESVGTQDYVLDRAAFSDRIARTYGNDPAADIESKLRI